VRILVLGGTGFIGRAVVSDAEQRGHEVTLFGRGRTNPDLFPQLDRRIGDRDKADYAALAVGEWDAVVDSSGYVVRHVNQAMDALGDRVGRYVFVSSHAVYDLDAGPGATEDTARRSPNRIADDVELLTNDTYGPAKVACEDDVAARFGARASIVRPGKVGGPNDSQNTFTYWVRRAARGGRVALPGQPEQPVQVVDSRDVAGLILRLIEDGRGGAYTAVGPQQPTTLGALIETCARVAGADIDLIPVGYDAASGMFPLVRRPHEWATQQRDGSRAWAAGMPTTPLEVTAADVLAWDRARGEPDLDLGFTLAQEAAILA
jgi:nucleoside-diphosphate-sugar epimerase